MEDDDLSDLFRSDSDSGDPTYVAPLEETDEEDESYLEAVDNIIAMSVGGPSASTDPQTQCNTNDMSQQHCINNNGDEDGYHSEEFTPLVDSDDEDAVRRPSEYQEGTSYGNVNLELLMTFPTLKLFKDAVRDYNVALGKVVKFTKNEKERCRARCVVQECKWHIYCSWQESEGSFQVKTFYSDHSCSRSLKNPLANRKWIGKKLVDLMRLKPDMNSTDAYNYMADKYQVQMTHMKIYRSMEIARELVEGSEKEQYALLHDYCNELRRSNPRSTIGIGVERVDLSQPARFQKLYICFNACMRGVQGGCRPLIGLDGCYLKWYYGGQLLSAVTQDANNSFYVIAYAVVEQETKESWSWFLRNLLEDIGNPSEFGWEFISDMQKGLLPAMQDLCPGVRHRYCVKHLEANVWRQWRSTELRLKLWMCAKSKTMPEFEKHFNELKLINEAAWMYLKKFSPESWSRAGFSCQSKNQTLLNNMSEQFNAAIVRFRGKLIITMLEHIRTYLMEKMNTSRKKIEKYRGPISPTAQSKLELSKKESHSWNPLWAGDREGSMFQVQHIMRNVKYVVNLHEKSCSCNEWDLCGIPCPHAVACIGHNGLEPEKFVNNYFSKEMWEATYRPFIAPVRGQDQWDKTNLEQVHPPHYGKGVGRPKKKRSKANDVPVNPYKAKRVQKPTKCSKCGNTGHNKRMCKGTVDKNQKGSSSTRGAQRAGPTTQQVCVESPAQSAQDVHAPVTSFYSGESAPTFIPTPGIETHDKVQRPWTYGYGLAPSRSNLLTHLGMPPFQPPGPAIRQPPRRPPTAPRGPTHPIIHAPRPSTPTTIPALTGPAPTTLTTPAEPARSVPSSSIAQRGTKRTLPQSRGQLCVSTETLQRASRTTRSMAAQLNLSTQESSSVPNNKKGSKK